MADVQGRAAALAAALRCFEELLPGDASNPGSARLLVKLAGDDPGRPALVHVHGAVTVQAVRFRGTADIWAVEVIP